MKKEILSTFLLVSFLSLNPVLGCSSNTKGTPTGGACSIAELNAKIEQENSIKTIDISKFKKETLLSPSQKIICRYSTCFIKDLQQDFGSMEERNPRGK